MPQMAPMWWTFMMMLSLSSMLMMMLMLYFNMTNRMVTNTKMTMNNFNWKW